MKNNHKQIKNRSSTQSWSTTV